MRLVDADKLLEKWNELSVRGRTEFDQVIMTMPTAFDVKKVVSELEDYKMWKELLIYDLDFRERQIIKKAIEIVKAGEIDE